MSFATRILLDGFTVIFEPIWDVLSSERPWLIFHDFLKNKFLANEAFDSLDAQLYFVISKASYIHGEWMECLFSFRVGSLRFFLTKSSYFKFACES